MYVSKIEIVTVYFKNNQNYTNILIPFVQRYTQKIYRRNVSIMCAHNFRKNALN